MKTANEVFDDSQMKRADALAAEIAKLFSRERLFGSLVLRRAAEFLDPSEFRKPRPDFEGQRGPR